MLVIEATVYYTVLELTDLYPLPYAYPIDAWQRALHEWRSWALLVSPTDYRRGEFVRARRRFNSDGFPGGTYPWVYREAAIARAIVTHPNALAEQMSEHYYPRILQLYEQEIQANGVSIPADLSGT